MYFTINYTVRDGEILTQTVLELGRSAQEAIPVGIRNLTALRLIQPYYCKE
jgi:hypothetical protein